MASPKFFHSLTFLLILIGLLYLLQHRLKSWANLDQVRKLRESKLVHVVNTLHGYLLGTFALFYLAYASHLVADSFTSVGMPLINGFLGVRVPEFFAVSVPLFSLAVLDSVRESFVAGCKRTISKIRRTIKQFLSKLEL